MAGPLTVSGPGGTAVPGPGAGAHLRRTLAGALWLGGVLARRLLLLAVLLAAVFAAVELLPGDAANATSERGET
ncbi:ABC transporter permease, partial [Streptomyces katsurahamanus]|nr:ABC transporter permease [Streptomyces katsurahamanus]